jgi:hypothetical protein
MWIGLIPTKITKTEGERMWWNAIAHHLDMVAAGHISGEWADPSPQGWRPPRIRDGEVLMEPHHR